MKRWIHILLFSCTKATELIEKDLYFKLSWIERIRLFLHTCICDACHRYQKQSGLLHDILFKCHQTHHHPNTLPEQELTALKQKITNRLEEI